MGGGRERTRPREEGGRSDKLVHRMNECIKKNKFVASVWDRRGTRNAGVEPHHARRPPGREAFGVGSDVRVAIGGKGGGGGGE
jgi:hypothetical protein